MSEIVCTPPQTNFDRVIAAKRAFRNAREAHKLSRYQLARLLGHDSERLLRAYEDEDADNNPPIAVLMHPDFPAEMFEQIVEKVREARGEKPPVGPDTIQGALLALQRSAGQYVTWTGTVGLGAASPRSAPQGLQLVETIAKNAAVAARFLIRAITGAHAAAKGGAR